MYIVKSIKEHLSKVCQHLNSFSKLKSNTSISNCNRRSLRIGTAFLALCIQPSKDAASEYVWIGCKVNEFFVLFSSRLVSQVGWLTVKDYYTFAWALAPEGYQAGTDANCSVAFYCMFTFAI